MKISHRITKSRAFQILRRNRILWVLLIGLLALPFILRWEDDGHHARLYCGPVFLDIDRSGYPGGDRDWRFLTTPYGVHFGHGQFAVSIQIKRN